MITCVSINPDTEQSWLQHQSGWASVYLMYKWAPSSHTSCPNLEHCHLQVGDQTTMQPLNNGNYMSNWVIFHFISKLVLNHIWHKSFFSWTLHFFSKPASDTLTGDMINCYIAPINNYLISLYFYHLVPNPIIIYSFLFAFLCVKFTMQSLVHLLSQNWRIFQFFFI